MIEERTGKILHLDGDRKYSQKAANYYKKVGLNAVVINIREKQQPIMMVELLKKYKPDILIITGHDKMFNRNRDFYDINNYKNSVYFINAVRKAREYMPSKEGLVIFAGACQSYFEALIEAGANFATSPARILIDFKDPIAVAEKVARTYYDKYVTINDILPLIRDGRRGVGGTYGKGKTTLVTIL